MNSLLIFIVMGLNAGAQSAAPFPMIDHGALDVAQLRALDFVAIVEPAGTGVLERRKVELREYAGKSSQRPDGWTPQEEIEDLAWSQPFKVIDSFGAKLPATLTCTGVSNDAAYRNYELQPGPAQTLGRPGGASARFLLMGAVVKNGELGFDHMFVWKTPTDPLHYRTMLRDPRTARCWPTPCIRRIARA